MGNGDGIHFSSEWLKEYMAKRGRSKGVVKAREVAGATGARAVRQDIVGGIATALPVKIYDDGQTQTERDYNSTRLHGGGRFEAITLRLPSGLKYTPDFLTLDDSGRVCLHEVKGSYRLPSYQRARLAFLEAVCAFPCFRFIWAELGDDGVFHCDELVPQVG